MSLEDRTKLNVELDDDTIDLALLSSPKSSLPCVVLALRLRVGMVFNINSAFIHERSEVTIEALDAPTGRIRANKLKTVLASHFTDGIAGHDQAGPLVSLLARGIRGQSGGAIWGQPDSDGYLGTMRTVTTSFDTDGSHFRRLVGLILAVDKEGREMAILPAPTIRQRLWQHFTGALPGFIDLVETTNDGIRYKNSGAVHFRGNLEESGTGHLGDGGTGHLADGGTGHLGDGGIDLHGNQSTPASGLKLDDRLWLSLSKPSGWVEYEALPQPIVANLTTHQTSLHGIYEDGAKNLFATDSDVRIPPFLMIPDGYHDAYPEQFNMSVNELLQTRWLGLDKPPPCVSTLAFVRKYGQDQSRGIVAIVCEEQSPEGHSSFLGIHVFDPNGEIKPFSMLALAEINCLTRSKPESPCPVIVKAYFSKQDPKITFGRDSKSYLTKGYNFLSKLNAETPLMRRGLRHFFSPSFSIRLERLGGYRITLKERGETIVIDGPASMTQAWVIQPDLAGP